jgi:hypothetical protein
MIKTLTIGITLTLFSTPSFAQSGQTDLSFATLPLLILVMGVGYFMWRKVKKKGDELLEQRLVDIENRLDVIERIIDPNDVISRSLPQPTISDS